MLLISILFLGFIIRLINLNQSIWLDEAINVLAVKNYSLLNLITEYSKGDFHPPGWSIILWFWTHLFGYSEIAIRIPSVIFGVLTIYIIFLIGKKLFSYKLGIIAAILLAINPLHIYYSQEARMYSMATLAVAINMLFFIKHIKSEKESLVYLSLSNFFVLISDYLAYFIFPAQLVTILLIKRNMAFKWMGSLIAAVLLMIWWFPTFIGQFNVGSIAAANLPTWKFVVGAFDFKTIPLTFVKFIIGRISLADKVLYASLLLPVCIFFGFLLWRGFRDGTVLLRKILLPWIILPLIIATVISVVIPIYNYFRVLYVLPGFLLLLSMGVLSFSKKLKIISLLIVVLVEIFCSSVYLFNPVFHREDWKGLIDYFKKKETSYIILFESSGTLPPFDYYAKGELNAVGALKDFPIHQESGLADIEQLAKEKDIYLVDYLVQISDPNRLVAQRIGELGYKQKSTYDFTGVGFVYYYQK